MNIFLLENNGANIFVFFEIHATETKKFLWAGSTKTTLFF